MPLPTPRLTGMTAAEIRERFLSFFEERGHLRMPSASLVPPSYDPSVLLTTAGMQPFKPYFRGEEEPPSKRLTSCQKSLPHRRHRGGRHHQAAPHLLRDARQLLGGRLLQAGRRRVRLGALHAGLRLRPGQGLDHASSAATRTRASAPTRRRSRSGAPSASPTTASCCSGARTTSGSPVPPGRAAPARSSTWTAAPEFGPDTDRPGDDTDRFVEFWNLVFMQYELQADGSLPDLPFKNIDTGMGLDRMAAILQDVPSVFETEHFRPMVELGEELSGRTLRAGLRHDPRPVDPRRPRTRRDLPDGGRRRALERGAGLHPPPDHAPHDAAGPRARPRGVLPAAALRDAWWR